MSSSRPVRIARVPVRATERAIRLPVARPGAPAVPTAPAPFEVRENRAGTQRANRLTILYAAGLLGLYAALAVYAETAPGGSTSGGTYGLELFAAVAVLLVLAGAVLAFSSSPRRVELRPDATVFVGRFGGRLTLGARRDLDVRVVRRFPPGFLTPSVVEHVEIAPKGTGRRRSFLLDEHLLDLAAPPAAPA